MDKSKPISRRHWLKSCASITGIGALSLLGSRFVLADDSAPHKAAKSAVQYQDTPKDGKMCGRCKFFIRSGAMGGMMGGGMMGGGMMAGGSCQLVEGKISPMGYCILYAPA